MSPRTKTGIIIAAFVLLAVAAVMGWARKPEMGTLATNFTTPTYGQPVGYTANGQPVYGQQPNAYQQTGFAAPAGMPAQNCVDPNRMQYSNAAYAPGPGSGPVYVDDGYDTVRTVRSRPRVYRSSYVERTTTYARPVHHRSTKKSVAIVAGSSGVGAAIGALAGGGKGAAIGALAGGAGGFLYDRLTANR